MTEDSEHRNQLELRNLSRTVSANGKAKTIVDNISYRFDCGDIYTIVGPSGAGKSSLLRLLNRLDEPSDISEIRPDTVVLEIRVARDGVGQLVHLRLCLFHPRGIDHLAGLAKRHGQENCRDDNHDHQFHQRKAALEPVFLVRHTWFHTYHDPVTTRISSNLIQLSSFEDVFLLLKPPTVSVWLPADSVPRLALNCCQPVVISEPPLPSPAIRST